MKNFPIKDKTGKEWWISRSVAVTGCILTFIQDKICILANKRGPNTPDYQGCWNVPCGYLDFDETTKDAVLREIYEETGVNVPPEAINLFGIADGIDENKQNVSIRYWGFVEYQTPSVDDSRGGELREVDEVKWIPLTEVNNYAWAFNQINLIRDISTRLFVQLDSPSKSESV